MRTVYKYTLFPDEDRIIAGGSPRVVHVGVDPTWRSHPADGVGGTRPQR